MEMDNYIGKHVNMNDSKVTIIMALAIAAIGAAFTIGIVYNKSQDAEKAISDMKDTMTKSIEVMTDTMNNRLLDITTSHSEQLKLTVKLFDAELALRDIKLNKAYNSAEQGGRHTAEDAQDHEDIDNERYYGHNERIGDLEHMCGETRKRVTKLEDAHNTVMGLYHPTAPNPTIAK